MSNNSTQLSHLNVQKGSMKGSDSKTAVPSFPQQNQNKNSKKVGPTNVGPHRDSDSKMRSFTKRVKSHRGKKPFTAKHDALVKSTVKAVTPLLKERKELQALSDEFDTKYVSVDAKGASANPYADKLKLNAANLSSLKSILSSELRGYNVPIRLTATFAVVNTAANLSQYVVYLDSGYALDFVSCAALFDEVRCLKVDLELHSKSTYIETIAGTAAATTFGVGVMGVDPCAPTALSGLSDGIDMTFHRTYDLAVVATSGSIEDRSGPRIKEHLTYHPPSGPLTNSGTIGAAAAVGNSWVSTSGSVAGVDITGYVKFYEINAHANNVRLGTLFVWFDLEFRMRD
jgi:hypothetical protein